MRREIGEIIDRKLKDPRIGMITVTGVSVTPDLRYARVYFTVLGEGKELQQAEDGLESARTFIQNEIGRRIRMKYTPELSFHHDDSLQRGIHIDKVIKGLKISHDEEPEGGDPGS